MYNTIKVKKAVIPAAGLGTRMRPLTNTIPKELLPVGNQPMMQYAIAEAAAAEVTEIFIIINKKRKYLIEDYYTKSDWRHLMPYPVNGGLQKQIENIRLVFLNQEKLLGVVDAVQQAAPFINNEPFLLLMPDNVYFGRAPISVELVKCFEEYKQSVLGLIEITKDEAKLYGNSGKVEYQRLKDNICALTKLMDKAAGTFQMEASNRVIRSCGRSILGSKFFEEAVQFQNELVSENDEVPVLQKMIANKKMLGVLVQGKLFDCGQWDGYWAANQYWLQKRQKCN